MKKDVTILERDYSSPNVGILLSNSKLMNVCKVARAAWPPGQQE